MIHRCAYDYMYTIKRLHNLPVTALASTGKLIWQRKQFNWGKTLLKVIWISLSIFFIIIVLSHVKNIIQAQTSILVRQQLGFISNKKFLSCIPVQKRISQDATREYILSHHLPEWQSPTFPDPLYSPSKSSNYTYVVMRTESATFPLEM